MPRSFGQFKNTFSTPKLVLIGTVRMESGQQSKCIIVLNLLLKNIEKLKMLTFIESQSINCISYGPFDNGHILLGLSDGWLLAYEYPSLERIESKQIFKQKEEL